MDNAQSSYKYSSIEMKRSPDNKTRWAIGLLALLTAGLFLFKGNLSSFQLQQTLIPTLSVISNSQTASLSATPSASATSSSTLTLGQRTKTSGCVAVNGLEDKACTPGAIIEGVAKEQICVSGYSKSVRNVSESTKNQVYLEYGVTSHTTGEYEVDHLISLELGGSNDISNLWPEAAQPVPGFHEKDKVENYLHAEVCAGRISLQEAQIKIANNWEQFYN
ncbi:MAG: HNH endonuclease signature motif containing protein [Candidatus Parcubacteria bacterium]|nr:HNH endonuclease signature motif containing protein [Candidatus Parcubacteria bacterium]